MGRSRGGLTTKIHALVDAEGRPIRLKLTEGQAHDGRSAADMLDTVDAGNILLADRAYDSDALRDEMAKRGAWANVRAMPNRVKTFAFSAWVYRQRNAVERFFNKLKHFTAVATRYDKRDDNFLASVQLASIRIWLRSYESVTSSDGGRVGRARHCRRNADRRPRGSRSCPNRARSTPHERDLAPPAIRVALGQTGGR
jgi:transposase